MDRLIVIKIGGNIIDDELKLSAFLKEFASIKEQKILVHGGGKLATKLAEQLNLNQEMIEGRRVTDAETLKVVSMVYAGYINKNVVAQLQSNGANAVGLSGTDGNLIRSHKRTHPSVDYGFVGDIDSINSDLLITLLENNLIPVIAPITHDKKGQLLNTNADTIAQGIAKALSGKYHVDLIYSFEKSGVLLNSENENSVIPEITFSYYKELKEKGIVHSGMIPKLDNAFAAILNGVKRVIIGKAEEIKDIIKGTKGTSIGND